MKSTIRYKKTYIYGIFMLATMLILPISSSFAGYGLKLKDGYLTFFMEIDDKRMVKLHDLPLEGEYFYDMKKASLIFTPKFSDDAYRVNVPPLEHALPKARFSRDTKRDGKLILGYETQHWRLSTNRRDCKEVFASKKLGEMTKFDMADIARINLALAYITGQTLSDPCLSHVVSKAVGNLIGLPLHTYTMGGNNEFHVQSILEDKKLTAHKLPEKILPFNADVHAKYLETLLTSDAYHSYMQTVELLGNSGITKLKALKQLLKNPANRRKILPLSSAK